MKLYSISNSVELAENIKKHLDIPIGRVQVETFADGEINIVFPESVRNESLIIAAQIQMPYSNLMELIFMCDAAKRSDARDITVIIPYLPHSRQERRGGKRSPISARVLADMLQNAGVDHIISMDLHIGAIEGFYKIPFDKLRPTDIFVEEIKKLNLENMILCSPDFGFMKKMETYKDRLGVEMCVINKKRIKANQVESMELIGGDVTNKNVIMIDDIIDTAGTLIKGTNLLIEKGAKSVIVFATHGVLSGDYQPFSSRGNAIHAIGVSKIKNVYISNTMLLDSKFRLDGTREEQLGMMSNEKIKIVDVSGEFAKAITKLSTR
ncbi:MAG: ribose-phosphate diphosphokinase [Richelia sp. RM2_1_2]|nr:ribose-phosphate diphosphokinase [Richelia sp. RM2_1_2]